MAAGFIAPDTTGLNIYLADRSLSDQLDLYVEPELRRHIEPHLVELGRLAGGRLDECARLADRHPPVLHHRDRFGDDRQFCAAMPRLMDQCQIKEPELKAEGSCKARHHLSRAPNQVNI